MFLKLWVKYFLDTYSFRNVFRRSILITLNRRFIIHVQYSNKSTLAVSLQD